MPLVLATEKCHSMMGYERGVVSWRIGSLTAYLFSLIIWSIGVNG